MTIVSKDSVNDISYNTLRAASRESQTWGELVHFQGKQLPLFIIVSTINGSNS